MPRLQRHWFPAGDSARPAWSKDISFVVQGLRRKGTRYSSSGEKGAPAQLAVFSHHVRLAPESGSRADMRASTQWAKADFADGVSHGCVDLTAIQRVG